jgi:hypothetical protein
LYAEITSGATAEPGSCVRCANALGREKNTMTEPTPPKNRRTWLTALIVVVVTLFLAFVGVVGGGIYWVSRHVHSEPSSSENAAQTLARERARFEGPPLLSLSANGGVAFSQRPDGERRPVSSLHVLAYDGERGQLVRVDIPGWLLRLSRHGHVRVNGLDAVPGLGDRITIDDLEQQGPGLVLDATTDEGARVLVWTE